MTDRQEILCPQCRSKTVWIWRDIIKGIWKFQCLDNPKDHKFKTDNQGNILDENGECKYCD